MSHVIQILCGADGRRTPHDGQFLVAYDPDTPFGELDLTTSFDIAQARRFVDMVELHRLYSAISRAQPVRPDGKPNRPITGLTLEVVNVPD